jgi:hypothetical protein
MNLRLIALLVLVALAVAMPFGLFSALLGYLEALNSFGLSLRG